MMTSKFGNGKTTRLDFSPQHATGTHDTHSTHTTRRLNPHGNIYARVTKRSEKLGELRVARLERAQQRRLLLDAQATLAKQLLRLVMNGVRRARRVGWRREVEEQQIGVHVQRKLAELSATQHPHIQRAAPLGELCRNLGRRLFSTRRLRCPWKAYPRFWHALMSALAAGALCSLDPVRT